MIEPSSLISRLMTFVLAGCLTTLVVLVATLAQMFPLERTQVFMLHARPAADQIISVERFDININNMEAFKENFIKDYITLRNQIFPNYAAMRRKWRTGPEGMVYAFSSTGVYADFKKTDLWFAVMEGRREEMNFRCDVVFNRAIAPRSPNVYAVRFRWICSDETTGQAIAKDFTIRIGLEFPRTLNWNERLDNPLGLKVSEYAVEGEEIDPLDYFSTLVK